MYSGVPGSGAAKAVCGARTTGLIASARVSESFEPRPTGAAKADIGNATDSSHQLHFIINLTVRDATHYSLRRLWQQVVVEHWQSLKNRRL